MHQKKLQRKDKPLRLIGRMLKYVRKFRLLAFMYLLISLLNTMISLVFGNIINESVGASIDYKTSALSVLIFKALGVVAVGILLKYYGTSLSGIFRSKVMREVRDHAADHIQKLPLSFMEHHHSGDLISRFTNDLATVQTFIGESLFNTVISLFSVVLTSVYLASINFKLFLGSLLIMPPILFLSFFVSRPMGKFFKETSASIGKANALAADSYGGLFVIKAFGLEKHFSGSFNQQIDQSLQSNSKALHRLKFMPIFNILLWSAPFTICLIYGAFLSMNGELSPGQLPAFVYLLNNIVWPVAAIPRTISEFQRSIGTAGRFFNIMDHPVEREDGGDFVTSASEDCVRFEDVEFTYDASMTEEVTSNSVLSKLSFSIRKGSRIALVGASGCGKSTVLKLISGFYENKAGSIELWGYNLKEWNLKALRSKISFVSQETYLYPASIRENIGLGRLGATDEEIREAARVSNSLEFILDLPDGFDTQVGERGIMLSGGQRQRLALARAFLRNAPIILLDEPTSALDMLSEAQVQEAMNRILKGKTAVIVTHRLSTIKNVDEILVMEHGRIAERGTHQQLVSSNGLYALLYNRQMERQEVV